MRHSARIPAALIVLSLISSASAQAPALELTFPTGGETLQAGNTVTIRWSTHLDGPVYLALIKGNSCYYPIGSTSPPHANCTAGVSL